MDRPEIESIWRYGYFQLAVGLPLLGCILLSGYVAYGDNLSWAGWDGGSAALALFGEHFKWPLAVLALAFPFGAWAIADLRSKEMQRSLNQQRAALAHQERVFEAQEEKRKADLYHDKANRTVNMLLHTAGAPHLVDQYSEGSLTLLFEKLFGKNETAKLWPLSENRHPLTELDEVYRYLKNFARLQSEFLADEAERQITTSEQADWDLIIKMLDELRGVLKRLELWLFIPQHKERAWEQQLMVPVHLTEVLSSLSDITKPNEPMRWPSFSILDNAAISSLSMTILDLAESIGSESETLGNLITDIKNHQNRLRKEK